MSGVAGTLKKKALNQNRGGQTRRLFHLSLAQGKTASSAATRRALLAAHQSDRERSGQAVELVPATGGGGRGVQEPQGRSGNPADLSSKRKACRSTHLRIVSGLLSARDAGTTVTFARARTDDTQCAGAVRRYANDRRASAYYRRSPDHSYAHHPARA